MSKRHEIRERQRKQKAQKKMITLGAIIIGAGLVAAALIYPSLNKKEIVSRYMAQDNAMGDPTAPIKIVEYSDYHCGHCGAFSRDTEPRLEENYIKTGQVYFVYRSVGGMIGGDESVRAAEASYCSGEQNMFWEMHDMIFSNQAVAFSDENLTKWAKSAGIDTDKYLSCMKSNTYADRVAQDEADAKTAGVSGTPSFIISYELNGEVVEQMLPGNYPYEAFQQVIDDALSKLGL